MDLAVLVSGQGSILESIINWRLPVRLVISDRECAAERIAEKYKIRHVRLDRVKGFDPQVRKDFTKVLVDWLQSENINLVAMAGFGTILSPSAFDVFKNRILNTHPSLLPAFPGWFPVRDALAYGVKVTGCTVHVATSEVDAGPILAQEAVEVRPDDTAYVLGERIKAVERSLYPQVIDAFYSGSDMVSRLSVR